MGDDWGEYLERFHQGRAGITERVLSRSRGSGLDPYSWLAEEVSADGPVLDLACGSAPLAALIDTDRYVGLDLSTAELGLAARRAPGQLVRASAEALPFPNGVFGTVTCSMALQVLRPLPAVLAEIGRVLEPGGRLVATLLAAAPLRLRDYPLVAGLVATLGRRFGYPNDALLGHAPALPASAGLEIQDETALRFGFRLDSAADAELLFASLYLPGLSSRRARAARAWLRSAAKSGAEMPIPIRRITAVKA